MFTPQTDYIRYWTLMACGTALAFALALFALAWLLCALYALGHPRHWTLWRVCFALLLGPMAVGDIMQGRKWW